MMLRGMMLHAMMLRDPKCSAVSPPRTGPSPPRDSHTQRPAPSSTFVKEDDGMTYNPFADAFKKMQDKKGKK